MFKKHLVMSLAGVFFTHGALSMNLQEYLDDVDKSFQRAKGGKEKRAILLEKLSTTSKVKAIDKKVSRADVTRGCFYTPLSMAISAGKIALLRAWLSELSKQSALGDLDSPNYYTWGAGKTRSLALAALEPNYPQVRGVGAEERSQIIELLKKFGARP